MKLKLTLLAASTAAFLALLPPSIFAAANVKTFGATGNGSTDDTAAIDAAIANDSAVYFPPGRYKYTNPNRMNLPGGRSYHLFGDGPATSVIEFYGNQSAGTYNGILMFNSQGNTLTVESLTLKAMTPGCGDAINAQFSDPYDKTRAVTVRNVQIRATDRSGSPSGYWNFGMYLWQPSNSIIDDVQIEGRFQSGTGIFWGAAANSAATQLFLTHISMLYWAKAIETSGHVEGLYMSNFELVGVGTYNTYALEINASSDTFGHLPAFHFVNGHINFVGSGIHFHNLSGVKLTNVNFAHVGFGVGVNGQGSATHLWLDDVWRAQIAHCDFAGPGATIPYENGIFVGTGSIEAQVSSCEFHDMQPTTAGSAIVVLAGAAKSRILDTLFNAGINRYDNYAGSETYIRDIP